MDKTTVYFLMLMLALATPMAHAAKKTEPAQLAAQKEDLSDLKQRLEKLKQELEHSEGARKEAADALKESEQAISQANKKLYDISHQQKVHKQTLGQLEKESKKTNLTLSQEQKLLSQQFSEQYMHGQQSYLRTLLESQHPNDIARNAQYFSYIAKARAKHIQSMQTHLAKVTELNEKTAATLNEVAALKQNQLEERQALQKQQQEKAKVVGSLSQQIATQRNEIQKLKRDEARLSQLFERLGKTLAAMPPKPPKPPKAVKPPKPEPSNHEQAPQAEEETPKESTSTVVASNDTLPDQAYSGTHFSALKGKLRLPVRGDVTNRFGSARQETGVTWKGLFIRASEGAEVKSVADGRVVFSDWMRGFGNLVIVDHGNGYMSLYGNNQSIFKQTGDAVHSGDTIAAVGNTGGNETNGLYYELRRKSQPFDPLSWSRVHP